MAHELVDDLKKGGSLLTLEDLARYTVVERAPVVGLFHDYTVLSAPPPPPAALSCSAPSTSSKATTSPASATAPRSPCT